MHTNKNLNDHAMNFLELLCDLHILLGLSCILPMMNALDYLMIFNQDRNCSIGDVAIKIYRFDLYAWYAN